MLSSKITMLDDVRQSPTAVAVQAALARMDSRSESQRSTLMEKVTFEKPSVAGVSLNPRFGPTDQVSATPSESC